MVSYLKNQRDLAKTLIDNIDLYWNGELPEKEMIENISIIVTNNMELLFNGPNYTSVINQRLGKKRIRVLNKIIEQMEG